MPRRQSPPSSLQTEREGSRSWLCTTGYPRLRPPHSCTSPTSSARKTASMSFWYETQCSCYVHWRLIIINLQSSRIPLQGARNIQPSGIRYLLQRFCTVWTKYVWAYTKIRNIEFIPQLNISRPQHFLTFADQGSGKIETRYAFIESYQCYYYQLHYYSAFLWISVSIHATNFRTLI